MIEVGGWSPALVIVDGMEKTAGIRVLQTELNDQPGVCIKISGELADVRAALAAAEDIAGQLRTAIIADLIAAPGPTSERSYRAAADYSPLIEQAMVKRPAGDTEDSEAKEWLVENQAAFAVGLIETQGFTAVFEAIDTAVKTAAVEVVAREKLGGGYITVVIKGDVAAVRAAVDAGKAKVEGLGKLIAAHVIPSPSKGVLSLLPEMK